jgi:hypothetical protein
VECGERFVTNAVGHAETFNFIEVFYNQRRLVAEYRASWTYPTETAFGVLVAFARDGRVPDSIAWFNDSGDGAASPHDPFDARG